MTTLHANDDSINKSYGNGGRRSNVRGDHPSRHAPTIDTTKHYVLVVEDNKFSIEFVKQQLN